MRGLFVALVLMFGAAGPAFASCRDDVVQLRGDFGQVRFRIEVADSFAERAQGLMHRTSMPQMAGMLFIYEMPQAVSFWMRNTLIPLDMIFVGADGRIRKIHENARPLDETPILGGTDILAVLEINGGLSRRLGLSVGDALRHPGLPQEGSAWAC